MKLTQSLFTVAFLASTTTVASINGSTVIAKYGNWYQGDDDAYAQCMILSDGTNAQRETIIQGMAGVTVETKSVPSDQLAALEKLRRPLPADSNLSSYTGYNFLQINETGPADIEVLGQAPGVKGNTAYDQYFTVTLASDAAKVIKTICDMESPY